jgi:hypothetical protein
MSKTGWAFAAMLGLACASSGQPGETLTPSSAALAYRMPASNPLTYEVADTMNISMSMGAMNVDVAANAAATMQLDFASTASGLNATLTYTTLSGSFTNSMGPSATIGESDKPGPATVSVSPRGGVTVLTRPPQLSATLRQVLGSESMYQRLFTRLPGRAVAPGDAWVDTLSVTDEAEGLTTSNIVILRSTLAGDTTVGGRSFRLIRSEGTTETNVAGNAGGFEIRQTLTGTIAATSLWDAARGILVQRLESTAANGTMDMPAMNMTGIPVSARGQAVKARFACAKAAEREARTV